MSTEDLRKELQSAKVPPKQTDIGLTIAWLLLHPRLTTQEGPAPTVADYKRNATLRDQFNAARLDIGMLESQVESVLKSKPLEQGRVDAGLYKIYGSNESFNIEGLLHFSNVLVVFRDGKVSAVFSAGAGREWRHTLGETFIDLVK